jgi:hypothetical protein
MLPIKVSDFLSKVGQPPQDDATKQELRDLFERYKDDEFHPDRDRPAFREPRRVSVEWVSARQDSPFQRKQAENFMLSAIAGGAAGNPLPAWALSTQIIEQYEQGKRTFKFTMPGLIDASCELAFYRNPPKPTDVASALGLAMSNVGTGGHPIGLPASHMAGIYGRHRPDAAAAIASETQRRVGVDATLVLTGLNPWAQAGVLSYADRADQVLPLDVVKKDVMDQVRDGLARNFLIDALKSVQTELEKLKGRPTEDRKKEADKLLAQAVKEHGLSHGTTEKPRDFFDIEADKGLKSMRESYRVHPPREDPRGKFFAALFFGNAPTYMPQRWPLPIGFVDNWQSSEEPFLYWITEEKKAYTPTYKEAEKKVIEAWRLAKADKLALKEAERIQQEVEKAKVKGDGLKVLREERAKNPTWSEIFPLSNVARLVDVFTGGLALRQYAPYQPDEDRIKARPDFVDQLMKALKENGDASVVWNRPGSIYYVVLLTDIHRPDESAFYRDYSNPHVLGDNLWRYMEAERRKQFHRATMEQLRADAGAPKGKWDVPEDIRKRIEGRDSGGDE